MQTVLVAGGAGFIGSHLCRKLLEKGYRVFCLDNLITGDKENIRGLLDNPDFRFVQDDITETLNFKFQTSNFKFIFHLASPASPNKKSPRSYINHPIETLLANSLGTYHLLELARKSKARFLCVSSSEIYGDSSISPQKEDYFGNVNPNGPRSVYDEGKRFGEAITMSYVRKFDLDCRIVRIFNTYGPNMQKDDGRVISNFINQAINNQEITIYGTGTQTRSFCYIDDMVSGLLKVMFKEGLKGEVFNLGNPDERTIREIASIIKDMTDSDSEIIFSDLPEDDPKQRKPDVVKAEKILGWKPQIFLEEGLEKTISYFRKI
ncbi:MAG: SDR family oxidoreductase [Patescibacteria group bacterium]|nr:SDR family oxidoreductase [Patescibacteria group bacterium]